MKKWFEQFPYPGWIILIVSFLLAGMLVYHAEKQQYSPGRLTAAVQKDFSRRQAIVDEDMRNRLFSVSAGTISPAAQREYALFIIRDGQIINWNTDKITLSWLDIKQIDSFQDGRILRVNHGMYYARSIKAASSDSVDNYGLILIPVAFRYTFENQYFQSHFVADERIPASTRVHSRRVPVGTVVRNADGSPAFYLQFREDTSKLFVAGPWVWLLSIIFLFFLFVWVHKCCLMITRTWTPVAGWLLLFVFCFLCNWLKMKYSVPLGFENATIFSPKLLASGDVIHSFPDLILSALFDTWLFIYFIRYVPIQQIVQLKNHFAAVLLQLAFVVLLVIELYQVQADSIYKLVIDSKISFEAADFMNLSGYTFLGIAVLSLITLNFIFILSIINEILKKITLQKIVRYVVVIAISITCIYILQNKEITFFYFVMLLMSLLGLILLDTFGLPIRIFEKKMEISNTPHTYLWFIILCSWITLEIFYFNYSKERELRKVFANKQEQRDDALITYAFDNLASGLQEDALLKTYWEKPSVQAQAGINKHIVYRYLGAQFHKYQATIYYYDKNRRAINNADTLDGPLIRLADKITGHEMRNGIVYLDHPLAKHVYWGMFPVLTFDHADTLGYLGFDFSMDKRPRKNYTVSLLQQNYNPTDQQYFDKYAYAIYRDHILLAQGGNQSFPFRTAYPDKGKEYVFRESWFRSTLYYQPSRTELIQVSFQRNILTDIISLFSFVLAVLLLLSALFFGLAYFIYSPVSRKRWSRKALNLTIRSKVNLTVLVTVFLSLVVVGVITVSFLKNRYKETQQASLQNLMFYFGQNIIHFIEEKNPALSYKNTGDLNIYPELSYLLNSLADEQGVDINLYNDKGKMIATSQSEMLQKGFLSPFMNHSVFNDLRSGMKPDLVVPETIGYLSYPSLYLPLRNKNDKIIAYLNLPYYASHSELRHEISGILATLINIYTLIFFISGISAILISNSIIRSFRLLIDQFRMIRLQHNVLIQWPYRDELGLLVKEYNEMIIKVEDMASKLANSEREAAWRELALQVAHEIKNPLTPMKLNIQYLQQAVKSGRQDIGPLTTRLTESLIEQIENMNVIASEFAHFAKMPDAQPECIRVTELLSSVVALFQKEEAVSITLQADHPHLQVYMDKSYFLRIFTNLIKNAVQAIPHHVAGRVAVSAHLVNYRVLISVADNGSGIPDAMQKKMFTPYFTTKSSGTGIGLAMSKNMVELSHGSIWFETFPGRGTTFFVSLPYYSAQSGKARLPNP